MHSSYFGGFDFVASAAGPTGQVRKDLTLLPIHTWLHLTPPLLGYNGRWSSERMFREKIKDGGLVNGLYDMKSKRLE